MDEQVLILMKLCGWKGAECTEPRYSTSGYCLDHKREYGRRWAKTEKGRRHNISSTLKTRMGVTLEQYESLMDGAVCAICGCKPGPFADGRSGMFLDHDHSTGKVRSPLCHGCNTGLGGFKDSPELLEKAAEYLREHANAV